MNITFRTDASIQIGTGHVMRCLTLANALREHGATCEFVCRAHAGNLVDHIESQGFKVHALPAAEQGASNSSSTYDYAAWLGVSWQQDAEQTLTAIGHKKADWLVVDHYSLDAQWERTLAAVADKIMVIDDLANRPHECSLLLDQTFGRPAKDYQAWVPEHCHLLCGSSYALLRPEFSALRQYSLDRRAQPTLRNLLITMGGVDKNNVTGQVLEALQECSLPDDCQITVVMGSTAPWLDSVKLQAESMAWPTVVLTGVKNMAQLMADSDLAIGAAGATSWERCCLGLPSFMVVLADNQKTIAESLEKIGASVIIWSLSDRIEIKNLFKSISRSPSQLCNMAENAARIVDGKGTEAVRYKIERSL